MRECRRCYVLKWCHLSPYISSIPLFVGKIVACGQCGITYSVYSIKLSNNTIASSLSPFFLYLLHESKESNTFIINTDEPPRHTPVSTKSPPGKCKAAQANHTVLTRREGDASVIGVGRSCTRTTSSAVLKKTRDDPITQVATFGHGRMTWCMYTECERRT